MPTLLRLIPLFLCLLLRMSGAVPATVSVPAAAGRPAAGVDDFSPLVKLAPFVVKGEKLSVSVHARSTRDRRYAEQFAEEVMKVVYEGITDKTGKGLVIIGKQGEPHPIFVFRKFLALAEAGRLNPALAARGPELSSLLNHWEDSVDDGGSGKEGKKQDVDLEFEQIVAALPLPLEGLGAQLYQVAWAEKFDEAKVEARLTALQPADLERDLFTHFDWVFYLPPRHAFDRVLDEIIAAEMKEEGAGFMARAAVKGVMLVVKPKIRAAIEGLRKGILLETVAAARTKLADAEVKAVRDAYVDALLSEEKTDNLSDHDRAVKAVRSRLQRIEEKARAVTAGPAVPQG